jgi:hypothetical protein
MSQQGQSSTLVLAEAPVARRLRIVMAQLTKYATRPAEPGEDRNKVSKYSRYTWVMSSMFEELLDELAVTDSETLGGWFEQFGKIIEWCGSGDDSVLPVSVRAAFQEQFPQEMQSQLAITAGE